MKGKKMGQHKVSSGLTGGSQITDADLATFKTLKAAAQPVDATNEARKAAFQFIISKKHVGKDGLPLRVNADMRTYFSTYGFSSDADAAGFINWVELG
jgi:hypothetical protein